MKIEADSVRFILGLKLKTLRQQAGASLQEIAGRAGLSVSYLSEIEQGRKYPKPDKLLALAESLGVRFDDLVSLRLGDEHGPLATVLSSEFVREFPFEFFGVEAQDLLRLMADEPEKAGALVRTIFEIGRSYNVNVEHFLLAALRSYQQANANYFADLEREAEAFRRERGWESDDAIAPERLRRILQDEYGYELDRHSLADDPDLRRFRSVFLAGKPPRLLINSGLNMSQEAFILGREIGYLRLGLEERTVSSSWVKIESFEQLLNNFKASYFAGAVLLDRTSFGAALGKLFSEERWNPKAWLGCLERYHATPEMFLYRMTELLPELFGLGEIFFVRFHGSPEGESYRLTKVFNLSPVAVPHGVGLGEHYCRRWSALRVLARMKAATAPGRVKPRILAQRAHFIEENAEFLVLTLARPLLLGQGANSSVSIGLRVNGRLRRTVAFLDDPSIECVDVSLTCERCPLGEDECSDRVARPDLHEREERRRRSERALASLLERGR